jgi:8-oxo-dGTP pyrophosphatase MutT (NUDIX family)
MQGKLDAATLTERLAGTNLPADPRLVDVPTSTFGWPRDLVADIASELKPAGVLIPLFERDQGLTVLLTERSAELKHHAGQIAFPGGRMEPDDGDIAATALRETREEVGIAPERVSIAGYLEPMPTVTGYAVTPVIGFVDSSTAVIIDRTEVSATFEVPLEFLMDESNQRRGVRHYRGRELPLIEFHYGGYRIWGATAHMLIQFRKVIFQQ